MKIPLTSQTGCGGGGPIFRRKESSGSGNVVTDYMSFRLLPPPPATRILVRAGRKDRQTERENGKEENPMHVLFARRSYPGFRSLVSLIPPFRQRLFRHFANVFSFLPESETKSLGVGKYCMFCRRLGHYFWMWVHLVVGA